MFSNKFRIGKIILITSLILTLCYYGFLAGPDTELTFHECMENSSYYDGTELIITYHKVDKISPDHFELLVGKDAVTVEGNPGDAIEGDYVSVKALFEKQGYLTLEEIHVHKGRRLKYVLSLLPLPFVFWFFIREFRITRKGFERRN